MLSSQLHEHQAHMWCTGISVHSHTHIMRKVKTSIFKRTKFSIKSVNRRQTEGKNENTMTQRQDCGPSHLHLGSNVPCFWGWLAVPGWLGDQVESFVSQTTLQSQSHLGYGPVPGIPYLLMFFPLAVIPTACSFLEEQEDFCPRMLC